LAPAEEPALRKNEGTQLMTLTAAIMARAVRILKGNVGFKNGGTYLALGDSVAVGTQTPIFTDNGCTNQLFQYLEKKHHFDNLEKLGCPGHDSGELLLGIAGGSFCYQDGFPPGGVDSQLGKNEPLRLSFGCHNDKFALSNHIN
jgi:hypothetical protein